MGYHMDLSISQSNDQWAPRWAPSSWLHPHTSHNAVGEFLTGGKPMFPISLWCSHSVSTSKRPTLWSLVGYGYQGIRGMRLTPFLVYGSIMSGSFHLPLCPWYAVPQMAPTTNVSVSLYTRSRCTGILLICIYVHVKLSKRYGIYCLTVHTI